MPEFAVSLIGMKRPQGSAACLEVMLKHATDCHFFVTANGCPETARLFHSIAAKHRNVTVTENAQNLGFQEPHARQFVAAAKMGCEFCLVANDDVTVPEGFLQRLAEPMKRDGQVAVTGPEGNCGHLDDNFHGNGGRGDPEYIEMSMGMIRISTMRQLRPYLWCDGLRFVYGEDSSLSLFVREHGFTIRTVPMHVGHMRSVTVNGDPHTKRICDEAQAANHVVNRKRWAYYLKRRRFDFPIVLKRSYAIGDALLVSPIIRAIAESNPLSPIHVQTDYPELFDRNPHVASTGKSISIHDAMEIELDGAYENKPMTHIVEAYEKTVREHLPGLGKVELKTEIYPSLQDYEWAKNQVNRIGASKLACIGSDPTTWKGKNWPNDRFTEVRRNLEARGWKTISVGSKKGEVKTTIHQLAALLSMAQLFVGNDSFPLHASQAMGCPTVGIFGPTLGRMIVTHGSKVACAEADKSVRCAGERHRIVGKTFVDCNAECINSVSVDMVMKAIERLGV